MSGNFNTLTDAGLPVLTNSGPQTVSAHEALLRAHEIKELDGLSPMELTAVLRWLVAIVVTIHRWSSAGAWAATWESGRFDPEPLAGFTRRWSPRFELFDAEHPFYQVAGLEPTSPAGVKPVSLLMPEVASGNNTPLFSSLIDDRVPPLTPAQAAIRLIALQGFDTASIKTGIVGDPATSAGKTTGNPTGPLGALGLAMPLGRTLFETIMLSITPLPANSEDRPAWERDLGPSWTKRPADGILDLLTWQSRRVRLFRNQDGLVDRVVVGAGDRLTFTPLIEPHTLWRAASDGPISQRPARHQPGKAPWRGLTSLLTLKPSSDVASTSECLRHLGDMVHDGLLDRNYPLDVLSVGVVYGNMSAVVEDVICDRVPLPVLALAADQGAVIRDSLLHVAECADAVMNALNRLDGDLRRARGGDPIPWDGGQRPGEIFAAAMVGPIRQLLRSLQTPQPGSDPITAWEVQARKVAHDLGLRLVLQAPEETFLGSLEGAQRINQARAFGFFIGNLRKTLTGAFNDDSTEEAS